MATETEPTYLWLKLDKEVFGSLKICQGAALPLTDEAGHVAKAGVLTVTEYPDSYSVLVKPNCQGLEFLPPHELSILPALDQNQSNLYTGENLDHLRKLSNAALTALQRYEHKEYHQPKGFVIRVARDWLKVASNAKITFLTLPMLLQLVEREEINGQDFVLSLEVEVDSTVTGQPDFQDFQRHTEELCQAIKVSSVKV